MMYFHHFGLGHLRQPSHYQIFDTWLQVNLVILPTVLNAMEESNQVCRKVLEILTAIAP